MKKYNWTKKEIGIVLKTVEEAKEDLNMTSWIVTNDFESGPITGNQHENGRMFVASALNSVTQEYEKIMITWKPAFLSDIRNFDYEEARECVYHELIHGLTQELYEISMARFTTEDNCREAVERLTQRFTRIVCQLISERKPKKK